MDGTLPEISFLKLQGRLHGQFFATATTLPTMDQLEKVVMDIGIPTEEEMSALPDPKPMDTTVPFLTDTDPLYRLFRFKTDW